MRVLLISLSLSAVKRKVKPNLNKPVALIFAYKSALSTALPCFSTAASVSTLSHDFREWDIHCAHYKIFCGRGMFQAVACFMLPAFPHVFKIIFCLVVDKVVSALP